MAGSDNDERNIFDEIDDTVAQITDEDVGNSLRDTLHRAGYMTEAERITQLREELEAADERVNTAQKRFESIDAAHEDAIIADGEASAELQREWDRASEELTVAESAQLAAERAYHHALGV